MSHNGCHNLSLRGSYPLIRDILTVQQDVYTVDILLYEAAPLPHRLKITVLALSYQFSKCGFCLRQPSSEGKIVVMAKR